MNESIDMSDLTLDQVDKIVNLLQGRMDTGDDWKQKKDKMSPSEYVLLPYIEVTSDYHDLKIRMIFGDEKRGHRGEPTGDKLRFEWQGQHYFAQTELFKRSESLQKLERRFKRIDSDIEEKKLQQVKLEQQAKKEERLVKVRARADELIKSLEA